MERLDLDRLHGKKGIYHQRHVRTEDRCTMSQRTCLRAALTIAGLVLLLSAQAAVGQSARRILAATGVPGGLIVHLGCGRGKLTAALRANDRYLVHGLDEDGGNVERARRHIRSRGLEGVVSVARLNGRTLPYTDNLVNLLVAEDLGAVEMAEVMRVLCPRGVAFVREDARWVTTVKPWPEEIDEWTHYLHDSDNNAVAHDSVVGPPRHLQWIAHPVWDRHHDTLANFRAVVSAYGRIFSIEDEGPIELPYFPGEWVVKARDAFNGLLLWKRPIPNWEPITRPHRTGPVQQPRRLVAVGDRVYVTLGLEAPVTALDAATGKTVRTYAGTDSTQEIVLHDGVLFLVVGDPTTPTGLDYYFERSKRYGHDTENDPAVVDDPVCSIIALEAESGRRLWEKSGAATRGYRAMSLGVRGERVVYLGEDSLVCLERATGREAWRAPRTTTIARPGTPPTVVIGERAIYSADGEKLIALALQDGAVMWSTGSKIGHPVSGPNILLAQGLVWRDVSGGLDPFTGEPEQGIGRPYAAGMSHHRCYRDKATDRYMITGRAGTEFLEFGTEDDLSHHWVRGTCQYGMLPCNGLLYATPDNCECYASAKLNGFLALAPERRSTSPSPARARLERGPAYEHIQDRESGAHDPADWPTFRHDPARGGSTQSAIPVDVKPIWQVKVGGRISQPVAADGRLLVSAIDAHTVYALDSRTGKRLWRFTAGGRVDSPPTVHEGLALFGCRDG
ncbi:MAG: PQQ-binding-like beta-propeller repeat protein, partial [Candidatus Brocadiaceae bacterium]